MAELLLVAIVALGASWLTLFSGFGLGTLLMPVLALLFPVPVAIAATAVVHLLNNLFKLVLVGRRAELRVVLRFGLTAGLGAVVGAELLTLVSGLPVLASYDLFGSEREIQAVKLLIGLLIITFAALELSPRIARLEFPPGWLPAGGLFSGFFGGLSGNQGALRAAFLIRAGLDKEAFVGTSVVCSVIVDVLRLAVYGLAFTAPGRLSLDAHLLTTTGVAIAAAFAGAWFGVRLLGKVTLRFVQLAVAALMILVGAGLVTGLL
ncbi:MAG: TSUP family transporter [Woeseiaceae bacterium]|nr:TSUP family transporter [Woeseiaceae bacterium]